MTSIEDYHKILEAKNVDPKGKFTDHQEFNNAITAWRQDILAKKVCFTAHYKTDWKFFMECNHSVYRKFEIKILSKKLKFYFILWFFFFFLNFLCYGMFKSPEYHEYSKRERLSVFLCCCSLFSIVSKYKNYFVSSKNNYLLKNTFQYN